LNLRISVSTSQKQGELEFEFALSIFEQQKAEKIFIRFS
jgi:hypothetical protein